MPYQIAITLTAERDLRELHAHALEAEGPGHADRLLDRLVETVSTLDRFPERGAHPPELLELGIRDFRQLVAHPYRIIYRVVGDQVFIDLIADGRRDMRALLARQLLASDRGVDPA